MVKKETNINDLLNRLLKVEAELEAIGVEFDCLTAACDGEMFPEQGGLASDLENLLIAATHETASGIGFQRQDIADLYAFIEFRKRYRRFSDQELEQIIDCEMPSAELKQQLLKRIGKPKELLQAIKSVRQDWNNSFRNRKYCVIQKLTKCEGVNMNNENMDEQWPPPGCPPLEWPVFTSSSERIVWYRSVIEAYAALWEGHPSAPVIVPVSQDALNKLETELGCTLPPALQNYYIELGALSLAERLCSVKNGNICIQPLFDAFPAIEDMELSETDQKLASELIAFGNYLGNGNMFCFHRQNGEIYYFDHDSEPYLTRFFSSAEYYLDGLMIRTLAEVYDDEEAGLELLEERFGRELVRKWLF